MSSFVGGLSKVVGEGKVVANIWIEAEAEAEAEAESVPLIDTTCRVFQADCVRSLMKKKFIADVWAGSLAVVDLGFGIWRRWIGEYWRRWIGRACTFAVWPARVCSS
jgi:hypothetical protein